MLEYYILDKNKNAVEIDHTDLSESLREWSEFMSKKENKTVAQENVDLYVNGQFCGQVWVSTVFLGINHSYGNPYHRSPNPDDDEYKPVLFETMIFGFPEDFEAHQYMERTTTWDKAEEQHHNIVNKLKKHFSPQLGQGGK